MIPRRARFSAAVLALALVAGCSDGGGIGGSGTIELDEVDVASLVGGRLVRLTVAEGDTVHAGDTLAVLDRGEITADLAAQLAQAERAASQARDLQSGSRPAEVLAARAEMQAAEAERDMLQAEYSRVERLSREQVASAAELDRARAARDASRARASAAREKLRLAEEGFRRQQVTAAKQAASAAAAQVAGARSRAGELVLTAPTSGVVLLKNFDVGELVNPGVAVVTLGDPERLWMRVYVGAPLLPSIRLGDTMDVRPIGSKTTYPGRIVEIATRAEFTPRAALTEEEQANLVFGVKVALDPSDGRLKPGLPADAHLRRAAR